ncbi:hypothetical protein YC2023_009407 [Brassica napus]
MCLYEAFFTHLRLWFPLPRLLTSYAAARDIVLTQFTLAAMQNVVAALVLGAEVGIDVDLRFFEELANISRNLGTPNTFYINIKSRHDILRGRVNKAHEWFQRYFFVWIDSASVADLNAELWLEPWPDDRSNRSGACISCPTSHFKTYGRGRIHFGRAGRSDIYLGELDELSELSDTTLKLDELSELSDTMLELNELSNTEDGAVSAAERNGPFQPKEKFIKSSLWNCFFPNSTSLFLSPFQAHSHQEYQEGVSKEVLVMHGKKNSTKIINFGL